MLKSLKTMNGTQMAGLMLGIGVVVSFVSGLFSPGALIIDMASGIEPANVEHRLVAKVENSAATTITATFYLVGQVLFLGGLIGLWRRDQHNTGGDAVARTGIVTIAVAVTCGMASAILDWAIVLSDRIPSAAGIPIEDYWLFAQIFNAIDAGIDVMLLMTSFIGYTLLGCGLARAFDAGRRRLAAQAVSLISFLALLLTLIGINAEGAKAVLPIGAVAIFPITAWLLALGLWLYREDAELLGAKATA
jgi:hypothetical protein